MNSKEKLLGNLNIIFREDKYINEMCKSLGLEIDVFIMLLEKIYNNLWFDTMDELGSSILANQMNISFDKDLSQIEKNSILEAKWKSKGKSDIDLLQNICDSWENGEIEVDVIPGKIILEFVGRAGIPSALESLKSEINKAKPAYLLVDYLFRFLLVDEVESMTLETLELQTLDKFAF